MYRIKFYQNLGDTQSETIQKIQQAFGDAAMSKTPITVGYNHFKHSQSSVESETCSGR